MKESKEFKKVWDSEVIDAKKRILLCVLNDCKVMCVAQGSELSYSQMLPCETVIYNYYSETDLNIKKKRAMTRSEILLDNIDHPRRLVKMDSGKFRSLGFWEFNNQIKDYHYKDIPENYKGDFSDLEVKKYEVEA